MRLKFATLPAVALISVAALAGCSDDKELTVTPAPTVSAPSTPTPSAPSDVTTPTPPANWSTSPTPNTAPSPTEESNNENVDVRFSAFMKKQVPALKDVSDAELVGKGKGFCRDFTATPDTRTTQAFYDDLKTSYKLEPFDLGVFMGAATSAYCEEMTPQLKEAVKGLK